MTRDVTRRDFLGAASLAALTLGIPAHRVLAGDERWLRSGGVAPRTVGNRE